MSLSKLFRTFVLACIGTATPILSMAQSSSNGAVTGTVIAPDGLPVSAAAVTLSNVDGPTHSVSTSTDGLFLLKELPSGTYTLKATSPGFAPYVQSPVTVAVGRTTHVSIQLTLASAQQTVSVTAAQSTFDTSQTSPVVNIDRTGSRNFPSLAATT